MQRIELEIKPRDLGEKEKPRNLTQLRSEGWIPGTLYGNGNPVSVAVDAKTFSKALHNPAGMNALFNLKLNGDVTLGIIKEVQRHVLKHNVIHVDMVRVNTKEKLELNVPVHTVGEAPGVKNSGGILEHITREIRIRCLPDDIPAAINLDVSTLELGDGVKVKDLPPLKGVEFLTASDTIVVNVVAPKVEEVTAPTPAEGAAATGAQPEVITKGKKEEEGAEGAAAPAAGAKGASAPAAKKEEKKK